jgi:hypothetical protein
MTSVTTAQQTHKAHTGCSKGSPRFALSESFWCLSLGSPMRVITDYLFTIEQNKPFGLPLDKESVELFRLLQLKESDEKDPQRYSQTFQGNRNRKSHAP